MLVLRQLYNFCTIAVCVDTVRVYQRSWVPEAGEELEVHEMGNHVDRHHCGCDVSKFHQRKLSGQQIYWIFIKLF